MKNFSTFLVIALLTYPASFIFPWWICGIVSFAICFLVHPGYKTAFLISFIAVFIIWVLQAIIANQNFDTSMALVLGNLFGGIPSYIIYLLTGLTGGIAGGMAGIMGNWTNTLIVGQNNKHA